MAHHSFAMFDDENQVARRRRAEFKYEPTRLSFWRSRRRMAASLSEFRRRDAKRLAREGWSSKSLRAGERLKMTFAAAQRRAGGRVDPQGTRFRDGKIVISP